MLNEKCHHYERYENTPSDIAEKIFFYPQWAGRFDCKDDFRIERCGFKSFLLLYTLRGCGRLNYRGESVFLRKGSVALVNCLDEHIYFPCGEWEFMFLHFDGANACDFCEHICSLFSSFVFSDAGAVLQKLDKTVSFCREKNAHTEAELSKCISDILYLLLSMIQKNRPRRFDEVCEYIEKNLSLDLSAESVAEHFGFSRSYFSTAFKKATGATLYEYLLACRLNRAKKLLTEQNMPISQVSDLAGFKDATTFIRAFRRKEGITPLKYKKTVLG